MRYQNVKSISEVILPPGMTAELEQINDSLKSIAFSIDGKFSFRVTLDSYNMYLQRIADPKTKEVYRVSGTVIGIPVCKDFDSEWSAKEEVSRLRSSVGSDLDVTVTVEKIKIPVEE